MDRRIELEALITEREGMIAENRFNESIGRSINYGDDSFFVLADKMRSLQKYQLVKKEQNKASDPGKEE